MCINQLLSIFAVIFFFYLSSFLKFTSKSKWSDNTTTTANQPTATIMVDGGNVRSILPFRLVNMAFYLNMCTKRAQQINSRLFCCWSTPDQIYKIKIHIVVGRVMSYILLSLFLLKNITKIRYIRIYRRCMVWK